VFYSGHGVQAKSRMHAMANAFQFICPIVQQFANFAFFSQQLRMVTAPKTVLLKLVPVLYVAG